MSKYKSWTLNKCYLWTFLFELHKLLLQSEWNWHKEPTIQGADELHKATNETNNRLHAFDAMNILWWFCVLDFYTHCCYSCIWHLTVSMCINLHLQIELSQINPDCHSSSSSTPQLIPTDFRAKTRIRIRINSNSNKNNRIRDISKLEYGIVDLCNHTWLLCRSLV